MSAETYTSDAVYEILLQKPTLVDGDFVYQGFDKQEAISEGKKPNIVYDTKQIKKESIKIVSERIADEPKTAFTINARLPAQSKTQMPSQIQFQQIRRNQTSILAPLRPPERFAKAEEQVIENASITNAKRFAPRYVELSLQNNALSNDKQNMIQTVRDNLDKIYSVEDIGNARISTLVVHDSSIDSRIYRSIRRSASLRGIDGNLTDISLQLSQVLSDDIDKDLLNDIAVDYAESGAQFFADDLILDQKDLALEITKPNSIVVNDRLLGSIVDSGCKSSLVSVPPSLSLISNRAREIQQRARRTPRQNSEANFATILTPISVRASSQTAVYEKVSRVATLIYRKEIFADGTEQIRLVEILRPGATKALDFEVKLGTVYQYWAHSVYEVESSAVDDETGEAVVASILFQSEPSESITIETLDRTPPPHPADFQLRWDYASASLVVSWSMPTNPTRDIKYFQIFRRRSIEEPFELLVEYDFNDSLVLPRRPEDILDENVIKMDSPLTIFIDKEFNRASSFIYAVASVDARGLVSNYSAQLQATFNQNRNRLNVIQVSPPGAPRPYPNTFVSKELFLDSIITTNRKRMKVYFDPEYLKIHDRDNNDLGLLLNENKGRYVVSIIDADRSQSSLVELIIKDERET